MCESSKKNFGGVGSGGGGGGGGFGFGGWGGQGGCEWRSEAFVKIPKKNYFFFFWGGGGRGGGGGWASKVWGRWVMWGMGDVNQE